MTKRMMLVAPFQCPWWRSGRGRWWIMAILGLRTFVFFITIISGMSFLEPQNMLISIMACWSCLTLIDYIHFDPLWSLLIRNWCLWWQEWGGSWYWGLVSKVYNFQLINPFNFFLVKSLRRINIYVGKWCEISAIMELSTQSSLSLLISTMAMLSEIRTMMMI